MPGRRNGNNYLCPSYTWPCTVLPVPVRNSPILQASGRCHSVLNLSLSVLPISLYILHKISWNTKQEQQENHPKKFDEIIIFFNNYRTVGYAMYANYYRVHGRAKEFRGFIKKMLCSHPSLYAYHCPASGRHRTLKNIMPRPVNTVWATFY